MTRFEQSTTKLLARLFAAIALVTLLAAADSGKWHGVVLAAVAALVSGWLFNNLKTTRTWHSNRA